MSQESDKIIGIRAVEEAVEGGLSFSKIFIQRGQQSAERTKLMKMLRNKGIPYQHVPKEKINRLSKKNHQGVVAFVSPVEFQRLEFLLPFLFEQGVDPLIAVLDRVSDVRNFGAIVRSAECMGVHAVVIPEKGAATITDDAVKTSSGALLRMNVCREKNLQEVLKLLKQSGLQVVAGTEKGDRSIGEVDFQKPSAMIMGSEGSGISRELLALADVHAYIPMSGEIQSLNVSVAAGICFYEAARQRMDV